LKHEVLITEVRTRMIEVDTETPEAAKAKVKDEYERGMHDLSLSEHIHETKFEELDEIWRG